MFSSKSGGGLRLLQGPGLVLARAMALFAPIATEGTFVPTDASGAGLIFTGVSGRWTRSGNVMRAYLALQYPVTVNGAEARIGGLPGVALVENLNVGTFGGLVVLASQPTPQFIAALAIVRFYAGGAVQTNVQLSGATVYLSGTYRLV